jgi:hypothetical protein
MDGLADSRALSLILSSPWLPLIPEHWQEDPGLDF